MVALKNFTHNSEMSFSQWFRSHQKGNQNDIESMAKLMGCQKSILTWKEFRLLSDLMSTQKKSWKNWILLIFNRKVGVSLLKVLQYIFGS